MGEHRHARDLLSKLPGRHFWLMSLGTALGFTAAASTVGLMSLAGWFLSASALAGLLPTTAHLFNYFLPGVGLRLFALLRTGSRYGERVVNHEVTFRILETLRVGFYRRLEPLAPAAIRPFRQGDLLTRIVADIDALDQLYLRILSPSVVAAFTCLLMFGLLALFHVHTASMTLILFLFAAGAASLFTARRGEVLGSVLAARSGELRSRLVEGLQGLAELTVFGAIERHREKISLCHASLLDCQRRLAFLRGATTAFLQVVCGVAVVLAMLSLSGLVAEGRLGGASLAGLVLAVLASFESISPLPAAYLMLGRTREAARRLKELVETPVAVTFPRESSRQAIEFSVHFEKVSFRYEPEHPRALDRVTLHVAEGRRTAVVGESGAGKSSLVHLLVRFFDPEEGRISLGRLDIRHLSEPDLRRHVVVLSQQAHLFAATIRENLVLAKPGAHEKELWQALAAAQLESFVEGLPQGLDTYLGESGRFISAGQAQRVALARAILKDAPVWVLDEPTEGLDRQTERDLVESLLEVTRGRTVLWITHRLADLHRMDQVVFLESGRVAGQGTHRELMVQNPRYRVWCARL